MEKIKVGNKDYKVYLAVTDEEHDEGLKNVSELSEDEGMIFIFEEVDEVSFWMKDTKIPLDIIFINEDLEVISVHEGIPESEDYISEDNVLYVLEVNKNSGIKQGDELDFNSEKEVNSNRLHVLDKDGNSQMELLGEERIFSRENTKILIRFAKKAALMKNDKDYKALGSRLFKFLGKQNSNAPEYVTTK